MTFSNLLVISFIIKLLSRRPFFTNIKEKYGIEQLRRCRQFERTNIKYEKVCCDLNFLLACKKEKLIPAFTKPKLNIETSLKTKRGIAKLLVKTELKNKHRIKNELKVELQDSSKMLRTYMSFLFYYALLYKVRIIVADKKKTWSVRHEKKLNNLRCVHLNITECVNLNISVPNVIHNFSTYMLSDNEMKLLSYSLEHYIPNKENGKKVQVEFGRFFHDISPHVTHLNEQDRISLKSSFFKHIQ